MVRKPMRKPMRKLMRKFLQGVATAALLLLPLMLLILLAQRNQNSYRVEGRKLLDLAMDIRPLREVKSSSSASENDEKVRAVRQAGVSFRWIPPSKSNPIQNKSRPHINGGSGEKLG